jgi:hypothetical protein
MNNMLLQLSLDEKIYIEIISECSQNDITAYSWGDVLLYYNNKIYHIDGESTTTVFLYALEKLLKKSLFGNLVLDDSLDNNPGYMWNEWINNNSRSYIQYTDINNDTYWVGMRYKLSSYDEYAAWIYNDKNYNIIFEVTPSYPFGYIDQENSEEVVKYKKWLESYQPILKTIISPEIAHQWIAQAQDMIDLIDKHTDILRAQE